MCTRHRSPLPCGQHPRRRIEWNWRPAPATTRCDTSPRPVFRGLKRALCQEIRINLQRLYACILAASMEVETLSGTTYVGWGDRGVAGCPIACRRSIQGGADGARPSLHRPSFQPARSRSKSQDWDEPNPTGYNDSSHRNGTDTSCRTILPRIRCCRSSWSPEGTDRR